MTQHALRGGFGKSELVGDPERTMRSWLDAELDLSGFILKPCWPECAAAHSLDLAASGPRVTSHPHI